MCTARVKAICCQGLAAGVAIRFPQVQVHASVAQEAERVEAVLRYLFPAAGLPPLPVLYGLWGWLDPTLRARVHGGAAPSASAGTGASAKAAEERAERHSGAAGFDRFGGHCGTTQAKVAEALLYDLASCFRG